MANSERSQLDDWELFRCCCCLLCPLNQNQWVASSKSLQRCPSFNNLLLFRELIATPPTPVWGRVVCFSEIFFSFFRISKRNKKNIVSRRLWSNGSHWVPMRVDARTEQSTKTHMESRESDAQKESMNAWLIRNINTDIMEDKQPIIFRSSL